MRIIEAGGACLLAVSLVVDGRKHVEVSAYHGEPQPANPFVVVATATANPVFLSGPRMSHIPE